MTTLSALDPNLRTNDETAASIGIKPNTLEIWRGRGKGPKFIKYGDSKQAPVRYHIDDINAWLESRKFSSTSAYAPNAKQAV
jgi:hypothetical protein